MNSKSDDNDKTNLPCDPFEAVPGRIQQMTNSKTEIESADPHEIRQTSISDAKRWGSIPPDWVLKLFEEHTVNPNWIKDSQEPLLLPRENLESISKELFPSEDTGE
jgi:hypothetical protein